ncbi:MAG: hypothetical protein ABW179_06935, partial [Methylobacterium sp.]
MGPTTRTYRIPRRPHRLPSLNVNGPVSCRAAVRIRVIAPRAFGCDGTKKSRPRGDGFDEVEQGGIKQGGRNHSISSALDMTHWWYGMVNDPLRPVPA